MLTRRGFAFLGKGEVTFRICLSGVTGLPKDLPFHLHEVLVILCVVKMIQGFD